MPTRIVDSTLTAERAEALARLPLAAIHREYPSHVLHWMRSDQDARPPRELTPVFFGSFDWHSAVHGHWCLVRLVRCFPGERFAAEARAALGRSFVPEGIAGELAYLEPRPGYERPYGLAWLLQLAAELDAWEDPEGRAWRRTLAPLEGLAARRIEEWLPKLPWPVRSGEHGQTAFALGLVLDWADRTGAPLAALVRARARDFYARDRAAPIAYEPSGHDFLSPALGEADLMRRVLDREAFARWLDAFLPELEGEAARRWLTPVACPDPADGKLSHLDGLNLSRAWMLQGIARALPEGPSRAALLAAAARHREEGLAGIHAEHYAGAHWLASFATYLLTGRGLEGSAEA